MRNSKRTVEDLRTRVSQVNTICHEVNPYHRSLWVDSNSGQHTFRSISGCGPVIYGPVNFQAAMAYLDAISFSHKGINRLVTRARMSLDRQLKHFSEKSKNEEDALRTELKDLRKWQNQERERMQEKWDKDRKRLEAMTEDVIRESHGYIKDLRETREILAEIAGKYDRVKDMINIARKEDIIQFLDDQINRLSHVTPNQIVYQWAKSLLRASDKGTIRLSSRETTELVTFVGRKASGTANRADEDAICEVLKKNTFRIQIAMLLMKEEIPQLSKEEVDFLKYDAPESIKGNRWGF